MSLLTRDRVPETPQTPAPPRGFRTDVQGLRAVAVGLVLLYHAGLGRVPGGFVGVDVFFVISGFLITGLLLKELDRTGRISLTDFYARRARRILPAATLVLVATAAMTVALLPSTRWENTAREIAGSAFNVVNWMLADSATDYLRNDEAPSPVQHFWSLAVEEQFYLAWPLLLVGLVWLAARRGRPGVPRAWVGAAVAVGSLASLAYSAHLTAANPGAAYFVTTTRAHELGIGALLAVAAPALARLRAPWSGLLGWGGLAAIAYAGLVFSKETAFPGVAALVPTLGAAAVIAAGLGGRDRAGAGALLSLPPARWVGDISYSLYLWHWPLLVVAGHVFDGLSTRQGLAVVALAVIPAWLSYRLVERPVMGAQGLRPPRRALTLGAAGILAGALAAGAVALTPLPFGALKPLPSAAKDDNPRPYADGCHQDQASTEAVACVYGDPAADYTVAVAGDSHAAHWVPAMVRLAEENGWRLETYTKSACPVAAKTVVVSETEPYASCTEWNENLMGRLTGPEKPDFVVLSSASYDMADGGAFPAALAEAWVGLGRADVPYAVIADTPRPNTNVPECVAEHPEDWEACAVPLDRAGQAGRQDQEAAAGRVPGVDVVDLIGHVCPEATCPAVLGDLLVYRDTNHLTATFSRSLAPALGRELAALGVPVGA